MTLHHLPSAVRAADQGRFDVAVNLCCQVSPAHVDFSVSQSLVASVYRQVGRHELAERFDAGGLAAGIPDPLGQAMCRLGLVADRIGIADLAGARAAHAAAEEFLSGCEPARLADHGFDPVVTRAWVGAELALMCDEPAAAVALLLPLAGRPANAANPRWEFEQAKTLLFLGVAQRCRGDHQAAIASLSATVAIATRAWLAALIGPAVAQLALVDQRSARQWSAAELAAAEHLDRHRPPGG